MKSIATSAVLALLVSGPVLAAGPAPAQSGSELPKDAAAPWEAGVSQENQQRAQQLFQEANAYVEDSRFVAAEAKYREALQYWDHPAIHFNLAQLLFRQGSLLLFLEHIEKAITYDQAPLGQERFTRALSLKSSVEKQVGKLEITCDLPSASVWLGEKKLLDCPGRIKTFQLPGAYIISTRQEGFPDNDRPRSLIAGQTVSLHIGNIYNFNDIRAEHSRWSAWKPWAAVGMGAALAAGGGVLHVLARNTYQDFDRRVTLQCGTTGCAPDASLTQKLHTGDTLQRAAIGSYALGGAVAATGVVLVLLNQTQVTTRTPDELDAIPIALMLGRDESGLLATWHF